MRLAIPAQERLARNALTVEVSCVNRTRKHAADAARSSARPAFSFIEGSTRSLYVGNVESEKGLKFLCRNSLVVRPPFQFHFLHLFICHRYCIRRVPRFAPIEVLFRMGEMSRAENVGTE
jgi:hypothetical protein